jgi:hypothetical protein
MYGAQRELATWRPVAARVDSTDVVWRSGRSGGARGTVDLHAARAWLTYRHRDSTYHAPVVRGAYTSDRNDAERAVVELRGAGSIGARVDPGNPYDVTVARPSAAARLWFPALFIIPGVICLALAAMFGRGRKRRGKRRPRASAGPHPEVAVAPGG